MKNKARYLENIPILVTIIAIVVALSIITWYIATKNYMTGGINVPLIIALSLTLAIPITLVIIIVTHKFRSKYYKKMFIALTIAYTLIILVSVFTVLYYFPGEKIYHYGTPYCYLDASTSGTESGKTQVNVTWMVSYTSRANIRWSDIPQASAKIVKNGTVMSSGFTWKTWPTTTYVTGGDTIIVTLNRATVASGSIIKLVLVYAPSGGTVAESSVTLNYSA